MGKRKSRSAIRKLRAATKRKENLMKLIDNINNVNPNKIGEYSDYCKSIEDIDRFLFSDDEEEEGVITLPPPVTTPPEVKELEGVK